MTATSAQAELGFSLTIPLALARDLAVPGASAAELRMIVALIALSGTSGRVSVDKPKFERLVGIRLDNAARTLAPLLNAHLETRGRPSSDTPLFDDIVYTPGEQKRLAGIITAKVNPWARSDVGSVQTIEVSSDEFRKYRSVAGVLARLRLAAAFASPGTRVATWRLDREGMYEFYGSHANTAGFTRGGKEHWSLSRAGQVIVMPAVKELQQHCRDFAVKSEVMLDDGRWLAIDLSARRTTRMTLSDLAARQRYSQSLGR